MSNSKNSLGKFRSEIRKATEELNERQQNATENELINQLVPKLREVAGENSIVLEIHPPDHHIKIKTKETRIHLLVEYLTEKYNIEVEYEENSSVLIGPTFGDLYTIHPISE